MNRRRGRSAAGSILIVLSLLGCSVAPTATLSPPPQPVGGTLRLVYGADQEPLGLFTQTDDANPATLDPHLDAYSLYDTWELFRCCLTRTLLSTNGRATADGGARIHPDVATEMPQISADGLTWTFTLKQGLRYAPPMQDVEITAQDFVRSFHRLLAPRFTDAGSYGGAYAATIYSDILGAESYAAGDAASISGLETPDEYTLVIRLTKPAGDFGPRIALPVVVPIPPSPTNPQAPFGVAEGHDAGYGRFLVASGPYMVEGSADLDFSRPAGEQAPLTGLVPGESITLVRNLSWDPASDELRVAHPDRIELSIVPTLAEAAQLVYEARADLLLNQGGLPQIPADIADRVRGDPNLGSIHIDESDFVAGILMNLAMPPFDDLFVRKAAAFAINKARIIEILGGPLILRPAHHMVPEAMEDNLLVDYRPYPSADDAGDLTAAMEMMRQSRYDANGDGMCDDPACTSVAALARSFEPFPAVAEGVREDLAEIGIMLDLDVVPPFPDFFDKLADPTQHYAMYVPLAWSKDALSPASFFVGQFYSPVALAGAGNGSLIGATPEQLEEWGYEVTETPNVDERIDACLPLTGAAQFECWAGLDQHMMENVLPSISYGSGVGVVHASRRVVDYEWDQMISAPSFGRIVLAPELTPTSTP